MGFNTSSYSSSSSNDAAKNDSWKAAGFINIYLPRQNPDGTMGKFKIGALPIKDGVKDNNGNLKTVFAYLMSDPENAAKLLAQAIVDFQVVGASAEHGGVILK